MIALYPGAYKPPHRGHFNVVKSLLDGTYNGSIYDKDNYKETGSSLLKGKKGNKPKISKVLVFVGSGERNGITKEESMSIWNLYSKYLGNVEILDGGSNPMFAAKDYAQANPNQEFVSVTGIRGDKDFVDLRRVTTYKNAPNVQGLALAAAPGSGVRATDFRNSILSGNLDKITDFFPEDLSREEILQVLTDLKDKIVAEILSSNIEGYIDGYFKEDIDKPFAEESPTPVLELKDYVTSLTEYMLESGMKITPLPEIKLRKDEKNASNFFGKTAYYSPNDKEIVLYVSGRHDKDVVRSYAHEMIHHIQNLEGRLNNIHTQNTNEDDNLLELEKEAYLLGNITFRNWEDSLKNTRSELNEDITKSELDSIEKYADRLFAKLGIDIEFTKHFLDRANDERNKKPITVPELIGMFKRLHKKHGKPLSKVDNDFDAVVKDFNNDINVPFAIDVTKDGIDMYAKTIMRKKDFKTSTPVYSLQEKKLEY